MSKGMDFLLGSDWPIFQVVSIIKDQNERDERVKEIEAEIADIKRRLPAHSVKPAMISQLEELEEELEQLKKEN